jgi:hypothetical protein
MSKLQDAKKAALAGKKTLVKESSRVFSDDIKKHFVRRNYWLERVKRLIRARGGGMRSIIYFSLCAGPAYDTRLFRKEKLIDFSKVKPTPFVYCESIEDEFQILQGTFKTGALGFKGTIEDIATDVNNQYYGSFWSTFPFDVINLDLWGDVFTANQKGNNIFSTLQNIIAHQGSLRKPYELWITWRVKQERIAPVIENAFTNLIKLNSKDHKEFNKLFTAQQCNVDNLSVEDLVKVGFAKWILYVAKREYSIIEKDSSEILVYSRKDKEGKPYHVFNFLLRIKPFDDVVIVSPACDAANFCERKYKTNFGLCFKNPINVDNAFRSLTAREKRIIEEDLKRLVKEYNDDNSGMLR